MGGFQLVRNDWFGPEQFAARAIIGTALQVVGITRSQKDLVPPNGGRGMAGGKRGAPQGIALREVHRGSCRLGNALSVRTSKLRPKGLAANFCSEQQEG